MGLIVTPNIWTQQPQYPAQIDRSNPLGAMVVSSIPFGTSIDVVSGNQFTLAGNGAIAVTTRGKSLRGDGATAAGSIPINLAGITKLSLSFWLYWDAYSTADNLAMEFTPNFNTNVGGILIDPSSGAPANGLFQVGFCQVSGQPPAWSFARPSAAAWHHYLLVMDSSVSGGTMAVYVDGGAQSLTVAAVGGAGTANFANNTLYCLSRDNASLFGQGNLQDIAFFNGLLTANDAQSLYQNPWQLYQAPPRRIWIAVGGATIIALLNSSLKLTDNPAQTKVAASVTAAQLKLTGQATQARLAAALTAAQLKLANYPTQNKLQAWLTAAALNLAGQPTQNRLAMAMNLAALRFTAFALTVSGAVATVIRSILALMGIGS